MIISIKKEFLTSHLNLYLESMIETDLHSEGGSIVCKYDKLLTAINPYLNKEIINNYHSLCSFYYHDCNYTHRFQANLTESISGFEFQLKWNPSSDLCEIKKEMNITYQRIQTLLIENLEEMTKSRIEGIEVADGYLVDEFFIAKENVELFENEDLEVKVMEYEDFLDLLKNNPQIRDIKYFSDFNKDLTYIILFKNKKVIGGILMGKSSEYPDYMWTYATSIIENEQGKGYSSLLNKARTTYLKENNSGLQTSLYSAEGFQRLRKQIFLECKANNIPLKENGLLSQVSTIEELFFKTQKDLNEEINNPYIEEFFLAGKGWVKIKDIKDKVNEIINFNIYDYSQEELIQYINQNIEFFPNFHKYLPK